MKTSAAEIVANAGLWSRLRDQVGAYVLLIKPGIVLLVTATGLAAAVREGSLAAEPLRLAGVLLGIFLAAGAANGLNQFWDRDIDALMLRTRSRRPLPTGRIPPRAALRFAFVSGAAGLMLLMTAGSGLAAVLGLATIAFYILVYTLWLKRRTPLNIVIGGAAGAAPPLIGWAAGASELAMEPLLMFLVIFLWTPPHFWALALCTKEEYARASIPMLPVVAGEKRTRAAIAVSVALLLPATAALGFSADLGWPFHAGTALLGLNLIRKVVRLHRQQDHPAARELFGYSIVYLAGVFGLLVVPGW